MLFRFALVVFLFIFLCVGVNAEQVKIVVNPIPNLLNDTDQRPAPYNHLLDTLANTSVIFVPSTRMLGQFNQADVDCLFPGNLDTMPDKDTLIQSKPVKNTNAYVFTLPNKPSLLTSDSVIALRRGFVYGGIREKLQANFVELSTARETLKFLQLSRVDGVIGYLADIRAAARKENVAMPYYDKQQPIYQSSHRFICHDTPKSRRFLAMANKQISAFIAEQ